MALFVSSQDYPSGKITEFGIKSAKDGTSKETHHIYNQLSLIKEISYGKIYIQKSNDDLWYINPQETVAYYLSNEQFNLLNKWSDEELLPDDTQLTILSEVKGLPSPQYSLYPQYVDYPVKATTKDGTQIYNCICHFSKFPPLQPWFKKIILLSDIVNISSSDLSLSHELRLSSMLAEEMRMSFYPFMVEKIDGEILTYDGITQFASSGEIKGNEIGNEIPFSYGKFSKLYSYSEQITYIVGKWDDRLSIDFEKYSAMLNSLQASRTNPQRREPAENSFFTGLFSWLKR